MGCSPALILRLSRLGWIKPRELVTARGDWGHIAKHKSTFYLWQVECLAWDFAISLSPYEVVKILRSDIPSKHVQIARGIPRRTVEIVREHPFFQALADAVIDHGPERTVQMYWGATESFSPALDRAALKVEALTKPDAANSRRAESTPSEKLSASDCGAPVPFEKLPFDHIYGRPRVARRWWRGKGKDKPPEKKDQAPDK